MLWKFINSRLNYLQEAVPAFFHCEPSLILPISLCSHFWPWLSIYFFLKNQFCSTVKGSQPCHLTATEWILFTCEQWPATPSHSHGFGSYISFCLNHANPFLGSLTCRSSFLSPLSSFRSQAPHMSRNELKLNYRRIWQLDRSQHSSGTYKMGFSMSPKSFLPANLHIM